MTACKAIAKLLKLNKILKIVDFRFCRDGSLRLDVKPFKNAAAAVGWCAVVRSHASGETYRWRVGR